MASCARLAHLSLQLDAARYHVKTRLIEHDSVWLQWQTVCPFVHPSVSGTRRRNASEPDTGQSSSYNWPFRLELSPEGATHMADCSSLWRLQ